MDNLERLLKGMVPSFSLSSVPEDDFEDDLEEKPKPKKRAKAEAPKPRKSREQSRESDDFEDDYTIREPTTGFPFYVYREYHNVKQETRYVICDKWYHWQFATAYSKEEAFEKLKALYNKYPDFTAVTEYLYNVREQCSDRTREPYIGVDMAIRSFESPHEYVKQWRSRGQNRENRLPYHWHSLKLYAEMKTNGLAELIKGIVTTLVSLKEIGFADYLASIRLEAVIKRVRNRIRDKKADKNKKLDAILSKYEAKKRTQKEKFLEKLFPDRR